MTLQALSGNPVLSGLWDIGRRQRDGPHRAFAPRRCDRRRAGVGGLHRQARQRSCRRSVVDAVPRPRLSAAGRAGDEPADVGQRGHAAQRRAAQGRRRRRSSVRAAGDQACGEIGDGRMLEPEEILAALLASSQPQAPRRQARAADGGTDGRSDRSGARHHESQFRQDGLFAGAGRRRSRRRGHAGVAGRRRCPRRRA